MQKLDPRTLGPAACSYFGLTDKNMHACSYFDCVFLCGGVGFTIALSDLCLGVWGNLYTKGRGEGADFILKETVLQPLFLRAATVCIDVFPFSVDC